MRLRQRYDILTFKGREVSVMWWWHGSMPWMMLWPLGFIVFCIVMVMLMMSKNVDTLGQ
jgi:hypothetical protein